MLFLPEKIKKGGVAFSQKQTKLWLGNEGQTKLFTLFSYEDGSQQTDEIVINNKLLNRKLSIKSATETSFSPLILKPFGSQAEYEKRLKAESEFKSFLLAFPIFFSHGNQYVFDYLGLAKSKDTSAHVITTMIAGNYSVKIFIDAATYKLLKIEARYNQPKTPDQVLEEYFSDYQSQNGLDFARKVVITENGDLVEERNIVKADINPLLFKEVFKH